MGIPLTGDNGVFPGYTRPDPETFTLDNGVFPMGGGDPIEPPVNSSDIVGHRFGVPPGMNRYRPVRPEDRKKLRSHYAGR